MKFREIISCSYYYAGTGYSSTECFSDNEVDVKSIEEFTVGDYRDTILDWVDDNPDEWYKFDVDIYAADADPMFNEPAKHLEIVARWNDGELKIEEV